MKGLIIVLLICGSWWWFWGRADGAVKVIEAQLEAVGKRDYASAYDYLATKTKAAMTPAEFQERFEKNPVAMGRAKSQFWSRSIENDVATISGTIESLDTKQTKARYVLIKENDRWVIQSFSF
ncbi:MAG: hypothetical protein A3H49_11695 [Nitrospirae bacterium RIFCSPLOWO2_02_FULL_62_14]|nr:MAG: hypothetical protein A3H49_11695 [Nitrospirae bacterium RIFCSPLOWO2_02_FULL_62_14]OGW69943.1 MAG: hypothetical protein A3A88_10860 [Nitrospirae bacterium RIFCSPLOWO2_01_FULL_62_17]